jgi:hypothetical protein
VVEHLSSMCEAQDLIPSPTKKIKLVIINIKSIAKYKLSIINVYKDADKLKVYTIHMASINMLQ